MPCHRSHLPLVLADLARRALFIVTYYASQSTAGCSTRNISFKA